MTLFSMLSLGGSALQTQQILMDVAGQNVANAATPGYSRQRAELLRYPEYRYGNVLLGHGAYVGTISRVRESLIDDRFRKENSVLGEYAIRMDFLMQTEDILGEPSDSGIANGISTLFDNFQELSNNPEDPAVRTTVSSSAVTLADSIRSTHEMLVNQSVSMSGFINSSVQEINRLAQQISELNRSISTLEAGSAQANSSRDMRDQLLNQLSSIASVDIRNNANGTVSVYLDGYGIVQDYNYNPVGLRLNPGTASAGDYYEIIALNGGNRPLEIRSGSLKGYLDMRDGEVMNQMMSDLDTLALSLIEEVNRIHSQGVGLTRYTSTTSDFAVTDPDATLDSAGLPFTPIDGSFYLAVYDTDGQLLEQHEITVDADTDSLNSIAAQINTAFAADGRLTATVTPDNQLVLETTTAGDTFTFVSDDTQAGDTSDFLLAMGLNTFFTFDPEAGAAASIAVSDRILADPNLIAAARSPSPGDNSNALALAQLRDQPVIGAGASLTIEGFFQETLAYLGSETRQAIDKHDVVLGVVSGIANLRDSISGVSLDEEAINIMVAQQAYEASAQFVGAVNDMLQVLLTELNA
ncbi:MAG: flagellar hook-associated protein FlgK [Candidatus Abyssobacteria bacterium SURF_5]|uniref:Flagellar hook-associated protein 1 n=1 Tax=Abyssobacteria bacterium (strain SURF_5) TaxID=2093360 RepID=A0A3A4P9T4_ABYX5|nr:MAG: flagellar hook-associated protein FlgK [Candidatus Abyssubacteria bacterium SURF_5]